MGKKLKYVALSAFVLPGLGQLCLGRRGKGVAMILLDNVFILAALFLALRSAGKLMLAGANKLDSAKVLAAVQTDAPYARWLLGGFVLLWIYGIVDAAIGRESSNN